MLLQEIAGHASDRLDWVDNAVLFFVATCNTFTRTIARAPSDCVRHPLTCFVTACNILYKKSQAMHHTVHKNNRTQTTRMCKTPFNTTDWTMPVASHASERLDSG